MPFSLDFNREGPGFIADLYSENANLTMKDVQDAWKSLVTEAQSDIADIKQKQAAHKKEFIASLLKDSAFRSDVLSANPSFTQKDLRRVATAYFEDYSKSGDAPWFMTANIN